MSTRAELLEETSGRGRDVGIWRTGYELVYGLQIKAEWEIRLESYLGTC